MKLAIAELSHRRISGAPDESCNHEIAGDEHDAVEQSRHNQTIRRPQIRKVSEPAGRRPCQRNEPQREPADHQARYGGRSIPRERPLVVGNVRWQQSFGDVSKPFSTQDITRLNGQCVQ